MAGEKFRRGNRVSFGAFHAVFVNHPGGTGRVVGYGFSEDARFVHVELDRAAMANDQEKYPCVGSSSFMFLEDSLELVSEA